MDNLDTLLSTIRLQGAGFASTVAACTNMGAHAKPRSVSSKTKRAKPEEIGDVVAFLAGPGASYLAATTIFADGGIMHSSPGL